MCGEDCFGIARGVRLPGLVGRAMGKIILYQEERLETNINFYRRSIFASSGGLCSTVAASSCSNEG